jgi:pimeloyl-ACP methyl ester carboxylesterase
VFAGLGADNTVSPTMARMMYSFLGEAFTVYLVTRRQGLPQGFTLADMADDYAAMIIEEFGGPVDVIGVSTGASIALHFAADHPELVRRLVIHSGAHTLSDQAKRLQLEFARLGALGQWRAAFALLAGTMLPRRGPLRTLARPLAQVAGWLMSRRPPKDASDLVVTVTAEDALAFRNRLHDIRVPTLVAGGTADPFYPPRLFRETAEGIPGARLALYEGLGHPAHGKRFHRDVLAFLEQ